MSRFAGRIALVTGAASGLGRATALALAAEGAVVACADLGDVGEVAAETGGIALPFDVSDLEANRTAVAETEELLGGLDVVHLNAGVATGCGVGDDFDLARYRRAMGANLDGVVFGVHAVLPALRRRGGGAIVATASLAGLTGMPYDPLYAANKHAVVGLVRSLAHLAEEGITVNAVCPGFSESRIIDPIRDALRDSGVAIIPAETVAGVVLDLLAGEVSGQAVVVQPGREPLAFNFRGVPGPR
jgi:NAD(P)-dependent dehydrogenase (short-subunit alcohol dehydrogenase family)